MAIDHRRDRRLRLRAPGHPRRGHLALGEPDTAPDRIEVTSRSLERAGKPWFPVTGEIHFSRIPRDRWPEVLGHARAGGLDSVATYVFWQAHEPTAGSFRWDGDLDLRAFVELARDFGLDVIVRMGPWAHGEARHGGFPDWLIELGLHTRTNDPAYLELVRRLYAEIIAQLSGLTHADGGPVVGVQMDNELYDQPQHLAALRGIAEGLGLNVPIWTATGWGGAQVPETLLPVYSAYSEGFWEDTDVEWPANASFHFRYTEVRDDLSVGKDLREALDGITLGPDEVALKDDDALPFATCELGGGMHVAYHRRPLVSAEDVANLALAKIGGGSIWQGYYMYAGGTMRVGGHGTEQESQATGYPNDVPTRTYDFFAPIGEFGQIRGHHHRLRRQHLWLQLDGAALAAMTTTVGGGSEDPGELRWSVRSDGRRGYLFLTTYQPPKRPIAAQPGVSLTLDFEDATLTVPSAPVDLPEGISVAWPLRYPLTDDLVLRSATAAILSRGTDEVGDVVVLSATPGIDVELVLEGEVEVGGPVTAEVVDGATVVRLTGRPGPACVVELPGVRVVILDDDHADQLYRLHFAGADRLVLSDAPVYVMGDALIAHTDQRHATIGFLPAPVGLTADGALLEPADAAGPWEFVSLSIPGAGSVRLLGDLAPVAPAPPAPRTGGPLGRLSAPTDFSGAASVQVEVPPEALDDTDRVLVRVTWTGDVGRAVLGGEVISDHFWHGRVWDIDVTPHRDTLRTRPLELQLLPWRKETGVWVDPSVREVPDGISISGIDAVRVARVALTTREDPRTPR
ncbi:beta-galactosidase [Tessaracoccus sp. G1721]